MGSQPSVGELSLASVVGMDAEGITGPSISGATMGGIVYQQHINLQPQSQAQNLIPSEDWSVGGMAGVREEMGGSDAGGAGIGGGSRGGNMMLPGFGAQMESVNLPGQVVNNIGGTNAGLWGGLGECGDQSYFT